MLRVLALSLLIGSVAAPASAQLLTTLDDSVAILAGSPPTPTSTGVGDEFGGQLGPAVIAWDGDVLGNLEIHVEGAACGGSDDVIVFYLDTIEGEGFASTSALTDVSTLETAAVSASPRGATLTFATGFDADYAIAVTNRAGATTAYLYELVAGGLHLLVNEIPLTVSRPAGCASFELSGFTVTDLGVEQGDALSWMATLLNASNGFRSDELHGVAYTGANIGTNAFTLGADDYAVFTTPRLLINEVDSQTPDTDTEEFIELVTNGDLRLDGALVVLFNGRTFGSYLTLDLAGHRTGADGYFVIGNIAIAGADIVQPSNFLQQGEDAVALYLAAAADFPSNTAPTTDHLIDALVYDDGNNSDGAPLLETLMPGQVIRDEDGNPSLDDIDASNQRCPNGEGGRLNALAFQQSTPSPGAANLCAYCGDGAVNLSEACDGGDANGTAGSCCTARCTFRPTSYQCGVAGTGLCDANDFCDGAGTCVDAVRPDGEVCNPSAGLCDVAEACDGVSAACPADAVRGAGEVCRAASGAACDVAETCDGSSALCPDDGVADTSVVCRPSAGACDLPDHCDGIAATCPEDMRADGSVVCRPAVSVCDVADVCAGGVDCPSDLVASADVVCRPVDGACDVAERCDGTTTACREETFADASVVCRPSAGVCDVAETCPGGTRECPIDAFVADGTACGDSLTCNGAEVCADGTCGAASDLECDDGDACTADACAEPGGCEHVDIAGCCNADAECDDGDGCTADTCSGEGGTCSSVDIAGCCESDGDCEGAGACTTVTCDTALHQCTATPVEDCCVEDADCDDDDACTTDACDIDECVHEAIPSCVATDAGATDDGGAPPLGDGGLADGGLAEVDAGCSCRAGAASSPHPAWLLSLLGVAAWRRRRR